MSKIEVKFGNFAFSGEGPEKWLSDQLEKLIKQFKELPVLNDPPNLDGSSSGTLSNNNISKIPLATYLKNKNATTNQNRKFLATSAWLHAKGSKRISTSDITQALKDNSQSRLGNSAECLNQNVKKGFCEKEGKQFFVTDDGYSELK